MDRKATRMTTEEQVRMRRFFDVTSHLNVDDIKEISDEVRQRIESTGQESDSLVYGEISYSAVFELLEMLKSKGLLSGSNQDVFLDLGSGVGKAMVMAAFIHPFQACIGYELIPELHQMAESLFDRVKQDTQTRFESRLEDYLTAEWPDAKVVLSNSTCLTREVFDRLTAKAGERMNSGTVLISMSKAVHSETWELVEQSQKALHWGMCSFFVYTHL